MRARAGGVLCLPVVPGKLIPHGACRAGRVAFVGGGVRYCVWVDEKEAGLNVNISLRDDETLESLHIICTVWKTGEKIQVISLLYIERMS